MKKETKLWILIFICFFMVGVQTVSVSYTIETESYLFGGFVLLLGFLFCLVLFILLMAGVIDIENDKEIKT